MELHFVAHDFSLRSDFLAPAQSTSALNGRIKSLERVFRRKRLISNALRNQDLAAISVKIMLTKSKKTSSAKGICRLVAVIPKTKCTADRRAGWTGAIV
jgi:hypothetical protein